MTKQTWIRVDAKQVPAGMRWDTMAQDRGQPVEVQYGTMGRASAGPMDGWKRIVDHTVGDRIEYFRAAEVQS